MSLGRRLAKQSSAIRERNICSTEQTVRWPTLVRMERKKKPPETDAERLQRTARIDREMEQWLAHMRAELKERRKREREAESKRR